MTKHILLLIYLTVSIASICLLPFTLWLKILCLLLAFLYAVIIFYRQRLCGVKTISYMGDQTCRCELQTGEIIYGRLLPNSIMTRFFVILRLQSLTHQSQIFNFTASCLETAWVANFRRQLISG